MKKLFSWLMLILITSLINCTSSFAACCSNDQSVKSAPQTETDSFYACANKAFGDCLCSGQKCDSCAHCSKVKVVFERVTMSVKDACCSQIAADATECTVGVDREFCRIIYIPKSGPVRQCATTHEDVKGKRSADGKCCQVAVDNTPYCVGKDGRIFVPGVTTQDEGVWTPSLLFVMKRSTTVSIIVNGKSQPVMERLALLHKGACCSTMDVKPAAKDGDECVVEVTREHCSWVGGGPRQPPQRICWTNREEVKGKHTGTCCVVTVDDEKYCVRDGGGIYVPGIMDAETVKPKSGAKSRLNKVLSAPVKALKSIFHAIKS